MERFEISNFGGGYNDLAVDVGAGIEANETPKSFNMDYSRIPGAACKAFGEKYIGSGSITYPLDGEVQLIYEGSLRISNQWLNKRLVVAGGKLWYLCDGNYFIEMGSGFDTTGLIDATHYMDNFIMTDHSNAIKKWDGLTESGFTDITLGGSAGFATLLCKCVDVYKDYLTIGNTVEDGTECATRYRWAKLGDFEDWSTADYNNIVTKAGDEIVKLMTLFDTQIVFKRHSVHTVHWTRGELVFDWSPINEKTVNIAPNTVARGDIGAFFYSEEGLMFTDGQIVQELPASLRVQDILKKVNNDDMDVMSAVACDPLHQYWLAVPLRGSSTNDHIIIYDWKYDTWSIRELDACCLGVLTNNTPGNWRAIGDYTSGELVHLTWREAIQTGTKDVILGKTDGYVNRKGISFSNNSSAYNGRHETGWFEPNGGRNTEIMRLQPFVSGKEGTTFTVEYAVDSAPTTWISTQNYTFLQTNVVELPLVNMRKTGRKVKFRFSNDNADEYFNLYKAYIFHQPRGIR